MDVLQVGSACVTFTPSATPGIAALTGLQELKLMRVLVVDPAVLAGSASSLTKLELGQAWIDSSLTALVRILRQMQQLQNLWLCQNPYSEHGNPQVPAPQLSADDCAMLVSPAKLTSLKLWSFGLAPGGAARMFEAGGRALHVLQMTSSSQHHPTPPLTLSDLGSLASAWPQLQQLDLVGSVAAAPAVTAAGLQPAGLPADEDVLPLDNNAPSHDSELDADEHTDVAAVPAMHAGWSALRQMTGLTGLWAGGSELSDDALQELATLTGLKSLTLRRCSQVTAVGLLQLTQLTGLTQLAVEGCNTEGWAEEDVDGSGPYCIELTSEVSCNTEEFSR
jgi:hypothetical protein